MKDQHEKITGYRDLTQREIDQINRVKELSIKVGKLIEELEKASLSIPETGHIDDSPDSRWVAIAKTDLQKGFMALVRSIAKPTTF